MASNNSMVERLLVWLGNKWQALWTSCWHLQSSAQSNEFDQLIAIIAFENCNALVLQHNFYQIKCSRNFISNSVLLNMFYLLFLVYTLF